MKDKYVVKKIKSLHGADPTTKQLKEQAVLLSHAWKVFRATIPKSDQEVFEGRIPSIEGLVGMVNTVARNWENKRATSKSGKYMKYFTAFCRTLDAHSNMLEILPSGSEYVSLFTGTLKTIIHASSNHEKIALGLGDALSKMSAHIVACEKEVRLHQTKAIQEKIALLYAHVFLFLEDTMKWYLKKPHLRFRDSFRQNFFDQEFKDMIITIQDHSEIVQREARLISMAETKQIKLMGEETLERLRLGLVDERLSTDSNSREQAELKRQNEHLRLEVQREKEEKRQLELNGTYYMEAFCNNLFSQIAIGMRQELVGVVQKSLDDTRFRCTAEQTRQPIGQVEYSASFSTIIHLYERDNIILGSSHLLNYFSPSHLQTPHQSSIGGPISLDTIAASRLKEWTTSTSSGLQLISIAGRHPKGLEPPPMLVLAATCVEFAVSANLPVISYFISLPPNEELQEFQTREVQALTSLTYALVRQLIEHLPAQFSSEFDFTEGRLALLNGTLTSWTNAVSLLRDLVQVVPKPLFCIIDGFQVLDDWSTEELVAELVKVLQGGNANGTEGEKLKVLITTTGRSRALMKVLEPNNLILADQDGARATYTETVDYVASRKM
ncbi:hypothetical protein O988_06577 [Pseudogymnoascus sp. VKM F-3808]|nr:hypothetical protein O988_06577 [Pseudogymnoascus sp. VKM F-3808]